MSEDRPTPPAGPEEEPLLEISSEDLAAETPPAAAPAPPAPQAPASEPELPPAPTGPHPDDREITFVQEPRAPAGPLAPEAPPPPVEAAPPPPVIPAPVPPAPVAEVPPPVQTPPVEVPPAPVAYQPPAAAVQTPEAQPPAPLPQPVAPAPVVTPAPAAYEPPPAIPQAVTPQPAAPQPAAYVPPVEQPPAPVMVSDQWYTTSAGQVYGPYSAEDIRAWLRTGQMSWDTQASRGGDDPWRPLSAIAEFNPAPAYGAPVGAVAVPGKKDKTVAGILGILLGWAGAHHWYLGNYLQAALYLVFFWTGIPSVLGLVEGIIYLTAPEDRFQRNYNKWFLAGP